MKYPGKAVDASLSLDRSNAMVELYEANWYQAQQNFSQHRGNSTKSSGTAHKLATSSSFRVGNQQASPATGSHPPPATPLTIRNSLSTSNVGGSFLKDGVSSLNKYQMTLDQIRALERESTDRNIVNTIKNLNGYKTVALRPKPMKLTANWDDWVDPDEEESSPQSVDMSTAKRQTRPRQQISIKPPSLKRSQTMVYNSRPTKTDANNSWLKKSQPSPLIEDTNDEFPTVISKQPQPIREKLLSTNDLSAGTAKPLPLPNGNSTNCDSSNLRSYATTRNQLSPPKSPPPPVPVAKPRNLATISRSKSVRFPSTTGSESFHNFAIPKVITKPTPPTVPRSRKISLDIKADLQNQNTLDRLSQQFEDVHVDTSPKTVITQHTRQASDSSTSSGHSSNTSNSNSSRNSQRLHDQFAIPRPRLIVPIHTYARKRRTGNLKDQDIETIDTTKDDEVDEGKIRFEGPTYFLV